MSKVISDLKQGELNQFQEELAKTYFSNAFQKEKVITQSHQISKDKKRRLNIGIIMSLIIGLIMVFFILNRIEVDIRIIATKKGEPSIDLIKNVVFYENSGIESKWEKGFIVFSNEISSKKAVLGIEFIRPLNLKENLFYFYSKGKSGGEALRITLMDSKNNFCLSKINELENSWQQFIINAEQAKDFIDLENITHIDLEINPDEKPNLTHSTVYFKDIYLINKKEANVK